MFVELKPQSKYLRQYVALRNMFLWHLMTKKVTCRTTNKWLRSGLGKVFCIIKNERVVAAYILRGTEEVTVFSKERNMGEKLLKHAEKTARKLKYNFIWARTRKNNKSAQMLFIRCGYTFVWSTGQKKGPNYWKCLL